MQKRNRRGICSTYYNKHLGIGDKGPLSLEERRQKTSLIFCNRS